MKSREARLRVGRTLKKARIEAEKNITDLSEVIDPGHLSRIENGYMNVTIDVLERVADAMDYEVDVVFRYKTKRR